MPNALSASTNPMFGRRTTMRSACAAALVLFGPDDCRQHQRMPRLFSAADAVVFGTLTCCFVFAARLFSYFGRRQTIFPPMAQMLCRGAKENRVGTKKRLSRWYWPQAHRGLPCTPSVSLPDWIARFDAPPPTTRNQGSQTGLPRLKQRFAG